MTFGHESLEIELTSTSSYTDRSRLPLRKPVLGLLGGPGAGKSHLASVLEALGAGVVDADALARQVLDDPTVRGEIVGWWGPRILQADGSVNRSVVGEIVFASPAELARLESVIHPRVNRLRAEARARFQVDDSVSAIVEDCPLLLERGLEGDCDWLVFVEAADATRLGRVTSKRGWSEQELRRRENHQHPLDIKRGRADYVFNSDADPSAFEAQARRLLEWATTKTA